jgi:hypothetical protein
MKFVADPTHPEGRRNLSRIKLGQIEKYLFRDCALLSGGSEKMSPSVSSKRIRLSLKTHDELWHCHVNPGDLHFEQYSVAKEGT